MYNMVYFLDPVFWVLQECSNKLIYAKQKVKCSHILISYIYIVQAFCRIM